MSKATPHSIRRRAAVTALLGASLVSVVAVAAPTAMAGATRTVKSGWWWAAQSSSAAPVPVPYGTSPGDILVSRRAGAQEKSAAVWIDLSDLSTPPASLVVDIPEKSTDVPVPASGDLIACAVFTEMWQPVQGGQWSARPRSGCTGSDVAFGTRSSSGVWSFDLTAMASSWVSGGLANHGFEIVPSQSLKYPSFEIALRAPMQSDIHGLPGSGGTTTTTAAPTTTTAPAPTTTLPKAPSAPGTPNPNLDVPAAPNPKLPGATLPGAPSAGLPGIPNPNLSLPGAPDAPDSPNVSPGDDRNHDDPQAGWNRRGPSSALGGSDHRSASGKSNGGALPRRRGAAASGASATDSIIDAATAASTAEQGHTGSRVLDAMVPDLSNPRDLAQWLAAVAVLTIVTASAGLWWVRRRGTTTV